MTTPRSAMTKTRLMTPGPTAVPEAVLLEMAQPIIHHRTKAFQAIYKDLSERLQRLFETTGPVLTIAGSGTTAFEAAQVSLAKPGSKTLTIAGGKFGERWQDVYDVYVRPLGLAENVRLDVPWGEAVTADQVAAALKAHPEISVITVVHSETSTATACDIQTIAKVVADSDALLLVDGITSVGAMPVKQDAWGIDVLVTGSQKAMMLPPGLGFVGLGPRAVKRLSEVGEIPAYNLDLRKWLKSWEKNDVPFTPPVSLIRGQRLALELIEAEGFTNVHARSHCLASATRQAFESMGLELISKSPSDSVTGAFYPEGVNDSAFRSSLRDNHAIHIAGGQDGRGAKWKNNIFRISHMGYVDAGDTLATLAAVEAELIAAGAKINAGAALATVAKLLA